MRFAPKYFVAGLLSLTALACDQQPPPAEPPVVEPVKKLEPAFPSTQELLDAKREPLQLGFLPLTLDVPKSWSIEEGASVTFLQGPAIDSIVQIQLSARSRVTRQQLESLEKGASDEQKSNPQQLRLVDARDMGSLRVLERQLAFGPTTIPSDDGTLITTEPLRWSFSVFVPAGETFDAYELIFIGITESTYKKNSEFLRSILDTLKYRTPEARTGAGT